MLIYKIFSKIISSISSFSLLILLLIIFFEYKLFKIPLLWNYIFYILVFILFSFLSIYILKKSFYNFKEKKYETDNIECEEISPWETSYIPTYIWFFLIVLGVQSISNGVIFIFILLFIIWLKLEKVSYFNFFWLILWYNFYQVKTKKTLVIIITKEKSIKWKDIFDDLIRLNDFTFLQINK